MAAQERTESSFLIHQLRLRKGWSLLAISRLDLESFLMTRSLGEACCFRAMLLAIILMGWEEKLPTVVIVKFSCLVERSQIH